MILKHGAHRLHRRRRNRDESLMLNQGPGVHQLRDDFALPMNRFDDRLPGCGLLVIGHAGLVEIALTLYGIRIKAFRNDQTEPAFCESLIVSDHSVVSQAIRLCARSCHRESTARLGSFKDPSEASVSRLGYECMVLSSSMADQSYGDRRLLVGMI